MSILLDKDWLAMYFFCFDKILAFDLKLIQQTHNGSFYKPNFYLQPDMIT